MKRTRKYKRKRLSKRRTRYRKHKRKHKRKYKRKITRKKRRKCRKKTRRQKYSRKYQKHGGCSAEDQTLIDRWNENAFKKYLISCGVEEKNIDLWKRSKGNKTLKDLWNEIKNQDIELKETNGKLERIIHVARAKIFHTSAHRFYLKEVKQTKKGKSKPRNVMLSEKMKLEERIKGEKGVTDAIRRGIKEELGVEYANNIRGPDGRGIIDSLTAVTDISREDSNSYPGLQAKYIYNTIEMIIPELTNKHPANQEFETTDKSDGKIITWRWAPADE